MVERAGLLLDWGMTKPLHSSSALVRVAAHEFELPKLISTIPRLPTNRDQT